MKQISDESDDDFDREATDNTHLFKSDPAPKHRSRAGSAPR
jgi:hypothetical protein